MTFPIFRKFSAWYANGSNPRKLAWLRKQGCHIGADVRLNCRVSAFSTEPYLITLGDRVLVADGVHFITHDGGIFVLRNLGLVPPETDKIAPIRVGSNVYIGTGASILPGVQIGNDCIIGAGAVVTRDVPPGSVAAGVPARVIEPVAEYHANALAKGCLYGTKKLPREEKRHYYEKCHLAENWFDGKR